MEELVFGDYDDECDCCDDDDEMYEVCLLYTSSLEKNQITDLSALAGMNKLKHLYLADNQVRDLSALKGMDSLQTRCV